MEKTLEYLYTNLDQPTAFSGAKRISKAANASIKKTSEWLGNQRSYSLHKASRKPKTFRKYKTPYYSYQLQTDLLQMPPYRGYKYILTIIDIFSRYMWAFPLKNKTPIGVVKAFQQLFQQVKPFYIQSDKGTEFYNKPFKTLLKKHDVKLFSVFSTHKASIVERAQKTLKSKITRYLTHANTKDWVRVLDKIVKAYNNSEHGHHKLTPEDARKQSNWQMLFNKTGKSKHCTEKSKLKIGDTVRVSLLHSVFKKEYHQKWSEQIYTIQAISRRDCPLMYSLLDYLGEVVEGKFYKEELQKIGKPVTFPIEKIIRKVGNRYLVRFLGYPETYWVDRVYK